MERFINIEGQKFNKLTVIKKTIKDAAGSYFWLCKCECGKEVEVRVTHLKHDYIKSCGCLQKEHIGRLCGKNKFESGIADRNSIYGKYRGKALKKGLEYALTMEQFEFLTSSNCYYCGIMPLQKSGGKYNGIYLYNGIDRVDNSIGYIFKNCVACCKHCNFSKRDRSQQEFHEWIDRVVSHRNLK